MTENSENRCATQKNKIGSTSQHKTEVKIPLNFYRNIFFGKL